ncbi:hypothetical protein ACFL5E_03635, partial [Candidatus Omnitrophota bacterium]
RILHERSRGEFRDFDDVLLRLPELERRDLEQMKIDRTLTIQTLQAGEKKASAKKIASAKKKVRRKKEKKKRKQRKKGGRATDGEEYRLTGEAENKDGEVLKVAVSEYFNANTEFLKEVIKASDNPVLLRMPVEMLDAVGEGNAQKFLTMLQTSGNIVIELFSATGKGDISSGAYKKYGILQGEFSGAKSRTNTITMLLTGRDDQIRSNVDLIEKMGMDSGIKPTDTILMPIGFNDEGKDLSGLIRSTVLGLRLLKIARDQKAGEIDEKFIEDTLDKFRNLCEDTVTEDFDLTREDLISLIAGNINRVISSLKKLIKLLPIMPINAEELREMYEHTRQSLIAA